MGQVTERYYSFQEAAERAKELARSLKLGSTIRTDGSGAFLVSYPRTAQVLLLEEHATLPEDKPAREEKIERGGLGERVRDLLFQYETGKIGLELIQRALKHSIPGGYVYLPLTTEETEALEEAVLNGRSQPANWRR